MSERIITAVSGLRKLNQGVTSLLAQYDQQIQQRQAQAQAAGAAGQARPAGTYYQPVGEPLVSGLVSLAIWLLFLRAALRAVRPGGTQPAEASASGTR